MSIRYVIAAILCVAIGFAVGWLLKGFASRDACLDAGGRWLERGGYCVGAIWGEAEY